MTNISHHFDAGFAPCSCAKPKTYKCKAKRCKRSCAVAGNSWDGSIVVHWYRSGADVHFTCAHCGIQWAFHSVPQIGAGFSLDSSHPEARRLLEFNRARRAVA